MGSPLVTKYSGVKQSRTFVAPVQGPMALAIVMQGDYDDHIWALLGGIDASA
jgi:hypothetical protein